MRSAALGLAAGALMLHFLAALPSLFLLLALLATAAALVWLRRSTGSPWLHASALLAAGTLAGFASAGLHAHYKLRETLPAQWEGRDITVVGTVASLPYRFERGMRFNFEVERVVGDPGGAGRMPSRLALSWYLDFRDDETAPQVVNLQAGERWELTLRLRRPHGNANPGGFDYEVWLLEQGLRATGHVRPDKGLELKNVRLDEFVFSFKSMVERCRGWLRDRIASALRDQRYAGVIIALVIGDQRAISQADWQVFSRTGIGHLISISGL